MADGHNENDECRAPNPILDEREMNELDALSERYLKLTNPSMVSKVAKRAGEIVPAGVKELASNAKAKATERDLYIQAMRVIGDGFKVVEEQAAKFTISEEQILRRINEAGDGCSIAGLEEICLVRSYDIDRILSPQKTKQLAMAFAEGAATGAPGFIGLPFNIVLSTFLFYRAVQSIAMFYGYDVKNNPEELMIASEVYMKAISPGTVNSNEISDVLGKIALVSKAEAVGRTAKKGWTSMARAGGIELLLTQMRALANRAAQAALEKAGARGLEESVFKAVFEQIGARLTQNTIARAVPFVSGGICALVDTALMNRALTFAEVFYSKRFLLEKEERVNQLLGGLVAIAVDGVEGDNGETAACEIEVEAELEDGEAV